MDDKVIIFLDADGVVNNHDILFTLPDKLSEKFNAQERHPPLSPIAVGYLNKLCLDNPNIRIVFSSTWRTSPQDEITACFKNAHKRLCAASKVRNIPYAIQFDDTTPESWRTPINPDFSAPRGLEIDKWLEIYASQDQKYIIIDDDADFFAWHMPCFIQTHGFNGITLDDYFNLCDLLKTLEPTPQLRLDLKPRS
jgi:hypothetical protein